MLFFHTFQIRCGISIGLRLAIPRLLSSNGNDIGACLGSCVLLGYGGAGLNLDLTNQNNCQCYTESTDLVVDPSAVAAVLIPSVAVPVPFTAVGELGPTIQPPGNRATLWTVGSDRAAFFERSWPESADHLSTYRFPHVKPAKCVNPVIDPPERFCAESCAAVIGLAQYLRPISGNTECISAESFGSFIGLAQYLFPVSRDTECVSAESLDSFIGFAQYLCPISGDIECVSAESFASFIERPEPISPNRVPNALSSVGRPSFSEWTYAEHTYSERAKPLASNSIISAFGAVAICQLALFERPELQHFEPVSTHRAPDAFITKRQFAINKRADPCSSKLAFADRTPVVLTAKC
ncbi:hypothetical protein UCDDS831_g06878 [Diplodia seriata]|uniref:Uncharacterized protein n=1 Tax=Diplodia seriata TaxID=420778 RepID=A0A0G2GI24_9PEZI|nr:hypothetical protein UCDDS831_g06878 [Diplodia seriata]